MRNAGHNFAKRGKLGCLQKSRVIISQQLSAPVRFIEEPPDFLFGSFPLGDIG
jgi:hypothetical protein